MKSFLDFMSAALPWLCMGLLLAVFFAKSGRKKNDKMDKNSKKKKDDYGTEGMCFGMCFGVALGTSLGNNTGIGLSLGMLLGLVIGSCVEKKSESEDE